MKILILFGEDITGTASERRLRDRVGTASEDESVCPVSSRKRAKLRFLIEFTSSTACVATSRLVQAKYQSSVKILAHKRKELTGSLYTLITLESVEISVYVQIFHCTLGVKFVDSHPMT